MTAMGQAPGETVCCPQMVKRPVGPGCLSFYDGWSQTIRGFEDVVGFWTRRIFRRSRPTGRWRLNGRPFRRPTLAALRIAL